MKQVGCRDLEGQCDFVATGQTADEVKRKLWEHATASHKDMLESMSDAEKTQMQTKIDGLLSKQS